MNKMAEAGGAGWQGWGRAWAARLRALAAMLLALVLVASPAGAAAAAHSCPPEPEPPTPEALQDIMQHARDHGFLWRVTKDGHSSYLYGTMHVGKMEWMMPGPRIMGALRATDTMALELDLMDPQIRADLTSAMKAARVTPLPEALEARLRKDATMLCVPWHTLAHMPPELQVAALDMATGREAGLDAAYAADAVLAGVGHGAGKEVVSLETPASQMGVLVMHTPAETVSYVEDNLKDLESADALVLLKRLATAWADSDYAEMARYPEWCQCLRTDVERALMKRMLDQRNPAMAAKIDALHASGKRVFAAVGSLHMFGADGLPALLQARGYTVERIDLAQEQAATH